MKIGVNVFFTVVFFTLYNLFFEYLFGIHNHDLRIIGSAILAIMVVGFMEIEELIKERFDRLEQRYEL